jgi:probable HAF family extracellular repeat protein
MKVAILLCICVFLGPFASGQHYTITDLGPISPTAINTRGQVAGNLNNHAVIWSRTLGIRDLGTLSTGTFSRAAAINDLGAVVGQADGPTVLNLTSPTGEVSQVVCNVNQAFVWTRRHGMKGLGIIQVGNPSDYYQGYYHFGCRFGVPQTYATGVDSVGQIVGTNDWSSNTFVDGFLWTLQTGLQIVPEPDDFQTRVAAINNLGQFAGARSPLVLFVDSHPHAAVWRANVQSDLGTLAGADPSDPMFFSYCSEADGINDIGQIVGWSTTMQGPDQIDCAFSPIHAVLWTSGAGIQDLGTLSGDTSSMAYAVNLFGQVIGSSGDTLNWDSEAHMCTLAGRPFVWTQLSGMQDLNRLIRGNSGWVLNSATAINILGQIVGSGTRNGKTHGFLLTPRNPLWN